jgi:hypothetical protein
MKVHVDNKNSFSLEEHEVYIHQYWNELPLRQDLLVRTKKVNMYARKRDALMSERNWYGSLRRGCDELG